MQGKPVATFTPEIKKASKYELYYYCPATNKTGKLRIQVKEKENTSSVEIDPANFHGEFAPIGTYMFEAGKASISVEPVDDNSNMVVDAILLKPKK